MHRRYNGFKGAANLNGRAPIKIKTLRKIHEITISVPLPYTGKIIGLSVTMFSCLFNFYFPLVYIICFAVVSVNATGKLVQTPQARTIRFTKGPGFRFFGINKLVIKSGFDLLCQASCVLTYYGVAGLTIYADVQPCGSN